MNSTHSQLRPGNLRHHHDRQDFPQHRDDDSPDHLPSSIRLASAAYPEGLENTPLSSLLWERLCLIEQEAECLDRILRRTWYLVGGLVLPCAGFLVYMLSFSR